MLAICVFLPYKRSVSNSSACENRLSTRLGPAIAGSARLACLSQAVTLCAVRYVLYTSHKNAKNLGVLQHPQSTHLSTALHSRRIPLNVPRIEEYHVHAQHHILYTGHILQLLLVWAVTFGGMIPSSTSCSRLLVTHYSCTSFTGLDCLLTTMDDKGRGGSQGKHLILGPGWQAAAPHHELRMPRWAELYPMYYIARV